MPDNDSVVPFTPNVPRNAPLSRQAREVARMIDRILEAIRSLADFAEHVHARRLTVDGGPVVLH